MNTPVTVTVLGVALGLVACGGSGETRHVKSQSELLEEQMALADEQAAREQEHGSAYNEAESDTEKAEKFDKPGAEHELKRAALNAVDCPNTFEKAQLTGYKPGTATLQVTFANDGTVKQLTIGGGYADTNVGNCIDRAMSAVIVKTFTGPEETMEWTLELQEAKPTDAKAATTPKKK